MDSCQLQVGSARASHFVDAETCEFHGRNRCRDNVFPALNMFPPPVTLPSVLSAVCITQN